MCEKRLLLYTCGCRQTQDPRPCHSASSRNKICDGYGFAWAYRDAIPTNIPSKCRSCINKDETASRKHDNEIYVAKSEAYPSLKAMAAGDDDQRVKTGRPIFDRSASSSRGKSAEIVIPEGWTSEMNRLPSNANEYSAFLAGKFNPLVRLPDTHEENQQQRAVVVDSIPHVMPRQGLHRLRSHAPPQRWIGEGAGGPVVLAENEYPYVEFRGTVSNRPSSSRRPSYTASKQGKGWAPLTGGALPPQSDESTEPPSKTPSPQLKKSGSSR